MQFLWYNQEMDTTGQYSRVSSCCNSCILVQYQVHQYIISNIIGEGKKDLFFTVFRSTVEKDRMWYPGFFLFFFFPQPTQEKVIEKPRLFYSVTFRSKAESLVLPSSLGWSIALGNQVGFPSCKILVFLLW